MADIKICDRCGNKIVDRRGVAIYRPLFRQALIKLKLFKPGFYDEILFKDMTMDLCEDCSNKLVWFLEGTELDIPEPSETTDA